MGPVAKAASAPLDSGLKIVRREQSARSRQHRGILAEVIYECDTLEIVHTEMDAGSTCDRLEFGDFSAVHFVIGGTPGFRTPQQSADLMPGDSIIFDDEQAYTIRNDAPSRAVILSVLYKAPAAEQRA